MSLVRLLGFRTLGCGCVIGRYRELATSRELTYIEEKGVGCDLYGHRRNHTIASERAVSARALVYIIIGHVEHHLVMLAERYGVAEANGHTKPAT